MKLLEKVNQRLLGKGYPGREAVAENFRILNSEKQVDGELEEFYKEKLKLLVLVLLGGVLLTVALAVSESRSSLLEDGYFLPRREKSYTQELWVIPDKESGKAKEELTLEIEPRGMTAEQVKTLLAAQGQQHLIMGGGNSAARQHAADQLIDQLAGADVLAFLPPTIHGLQFQCLTAALAPLGERELPGIELAVDKGVAHFTPGGRAVHKRQRVARQVHARGPVRWLRSLFGQRPGGLCRSDGAAYKKTVTGPRIDITLGYQAFVDQYCGIARNPGQHGQITARWQPCTARQTPVEHGRDKRGAQLHLQRLIVPAHFGQQLAPHQIVLTGAHGLSGNQVGERHPNPRLFCRAM